MEETLRESVNVLVSRGGGGRRGVHWCTVQP